MLIIRWNVLAISLYLGEEGSGQTHVRKEMQNQREFTEVLPGRSKGELESESWGVPMDSGITLSGPWANLHFVSNPKPPI